MSTILGFLPGVDSLLKWWPWIGGAAGIAGTGFSLLKWAPGIGPALRWLPWIVAAVGVIGGGGYGVVERGNYQAEKAARAGDQAAAEKAVREAAERDALATAEIENAHAAEVAQLKEGFNAREIAIAATAPSDTCVVTPAVRALLDGLRRRTGALGAGRPDAAGAASAGGR